MCVLNLKQTTKFDFQVINWEFSGVLGKIGLTGYLAILVGAGITMLVQSSSVFTSTLTPLVGLGVITVERMYPLTLGANIGTTITSLLAALANPSNIELTLQIAFVHLFFNISGILLFFPIPITRKIPLSLAKKLGHVTADYRWFAFAYLITIFFILPGIVFGLSVAGWEVLAGVGIPVVVLLVVVIVINALQEKKPSLLPPVLRSWSWLPAPLRSLEPYDRVFKSCGRKCPCCSDKSTGPDGSRGGNTVELGVPSKSETNGKILLSSDDNYI